VYANQPTFEIGIAFTLIASPQRCRGRMFHPDDGIPSQRAASDTPGIDPMDGCRRNLARRDQSWSTPARAANGCGDAVQQRQ